jgi:hypothetical protein
VDWILTDSNGHDYSWWKEYLDQSHKCGTVQGQIFPVKESSGQKQVHILDGLETRQGDLVLRSHFCAVHLSIIGDVSHNVVVMSRARGE